MRPVLTSTTVLAAATVLALVSALGCATLSSEQRALHRATTTASDAADDASGALDDLDTIQLQARYNPCHCPAPDFEVQLHGRWQRVIVDGQQQLIDELRDDAARLEQSPGLAVIWLEGDVTGTERFEPTGVSYQRLEVVEFHLDDPGM